MTDVLPKTIEEAKLLHSTRYFDGVPCKRGHIGPRCTSDNSCVECDRENARFREERKIAFRQNFIGWQFDKPFVSRKTAIEAGLEFYFTGETCKRGHISERSIKNNNVCVDCEKMEL